MAYKTKPIHAWNRDCNFGDRSFALCSKRVFCGGGPKFDIDPQVTCKRCINKLKSVSRHISTSQDYKTLKHEQMTSVGYVLDEDGKD